MSLEFDRSRIATVSTKAAGIIGQSIGGGGGTGGSSIAYNEGIAAAASIAVGGTGGAGGHGGNSTVLLAGTEVLTGYNALYPVTAPTNLLPVDAFGIVAQSIGGGGGSGGSALAATLAIGIPTPPVSVTTTLDIAVGGNGTAGGNGGVASVALSGNSSVITAGQGSHGILAQSIGGGGGNGGDSSMVSATFAYGRGAGTDPEQGLGVTAGIQAGIGLGGAGGSGGTGGTAQVVLSGAPSGENSVLTYGDYSAAVLAQSIGGGGGNAGFGSSTTQAFGNGFGFSAMLALGGDGGTGSDGGTAAITLESTARVKTLASGSPGLVAQSIGGGGGTSGGGSFNFGGSFSNGLGPGTISPSASLDIQFGNKGAEGGRGGAAYAIVLGQVTTIGGDSPGVLVQSIGGGGGLGGSAGSDASADNPVLDEITGGRKFATYVATTTVPLSGTLSLSFGGTGGTGAQGGSAAANIENQIQTLGDWSHGAFVQSVGGGGGKGGTAMSHGSGVIPVIALNLDASVGGGGGGGGAGGTVSLGLFNAAISTGNSTGGWNGTSTGYSAFGVLAQSVGGGGGFGADGSNQATGIISVGYTDGGGGGAAGNGGEVDVNLGNSTVSTAGESAHGMVLQSVGGTGGIAGAGSSLFAGTYDNTAGTVGLTVGGGENSSGAGNIVRLESNEGLRVTTAGDSAFGILAQSIGGGGGIGFAQNSSSNATINGSLNNSTINLGGRSGSSQATGGSVSIRVAGGSLATSGNGSHGIVAQSVGGGGGIANYAAADTGFSLSGMLSTTNVTKGGGGAVAVDYSGSISATGAGAIGILAQSVGGGGGLLGNGNTLYAGTSGASGSEGAGGNVTVAQSGNVTTSGNGSVGIFAQSSGYGAGGAVQITVSGSVTGGGGAGGAGIVVSGGSAANQLTIAPGGSIGALSGNAIRTSGSGNPTSSSYSGLSISNQGLIIGSIFGDGSEGQPGTLDNLTGGEIRAGVTIHTASFTSNGTFVVAGALPMGIGTTTIISDFQHESAATIEFNILSTGFSSLIVEGENTEFTGHLNVWFEEGYLPGLGDEYTLITAPIAEWNYAFATTDIFGLPGGYEVEFFSMVTPELDVTWNLRIFAVPEPGVIGQLSVALLLWVLFSRRKSRREANGRQNVFG